MNKFDDFDSALKFISSIYSHKYHNQPSTSNSQTELFNEEIIK